MISYIKGEYTESDENGVVIETCGVGYYIYASAPVIGSLGHIGSEVKLYTYMKVSDDGVALYGFATNSELKLFEKLISVSGVGPKAGISILSTLSERELCTAIISDDEKAISAAPGVGAKTAKRIIMELRDSIDAAGAVYGGLPPGDSAVGAPEKDDNGSEALLALISLGYTRAEAVKAVSGITYSDDTPVSEIITKALKIL